MGCVKLKVDHRAAAKDLYRSRLWAGRRAYAEESGHPWLVLSALHGLVDPEVPLDPYDLALTDLSAPDRRAWGERVVAALEQRFRDLNGMIFEAHAGNAYRRAIEPGVIKCGGRIDAPLHRLSLGWQLAWYASRSRSPKRKRGAVTTSDESGRQHARAPLAGPRLKRPRWRRGSS